ncbi:MAG: hypothetical protein JO131_05885 [Gammaproteobacteria bacterium]|nr:hypothetical protein [Gammaproteobacteria bacterium]
MIRRYNQVSGNGNYVYMLKAAGAVNKGNSSTAQTEGEYTVPGGVDAEDIIAFRQLSKTSSIPGFNGSSLYIRESFLKKYGEDYLQKILSVYLEKNEIATPININDREGSPDNDSLPIFKKMGS